MIFNKIEFNINRSLRSLLYYQLFLAPCTLISLLKVLYFRIISSGNFIHLQFLNIRVIFNKIEFNINRSLRSVLNYQLFLAPCYKYCIIYIINFIIILYTLIVHSSSVKSGTPRLKVPRTTTVCCQFAWEPRLYVSCPTIAKIPTPFGPRSIVSSTIQRDESQRYLRTFKLFVNIHADGKTRVSLRL